MRFKELCYYYYYYNYYYYYYKPFELNRIYSFLMTNACPLNCIFDTVAVTLLEGPEGRMPIFFKFPVTKSQSQRFETNFPRAKPTNPNSHFTPSGPSQ